MRTRITKTGVTLWLTEAETYQWAHRPGSAWPCSSLSGHRLRAEFNCNGLCDLWLGGHYQGHENNAFPSAEFSACVADHLADRLPKDHPCYDVVVGQFLKTA